MLKSIEAKSLNWHVVNFINTSDITVIYITCVHTNNEVVTVLY